MRRTINQFLSEHFDFDQINIWELFCDLDLGILMTDEKGVMIFYNETQANIDNLDPADVIGKKITDVYKYHNDSSTCMRVLQHGRPIINYSLSYQSKNANVGNTIHSVFPLFKHGKVVATICFVKEYNILERSIPSFLNPSNNTVFAEGTRFTFASIIGSAPAFVNAVKSAKMAANAPSPVMLYGETGTGKELFAQAIHNFYYGNGAHYIDVNCAAIPENLIEGILFGTAKGAYTGAVDRAGLFEKANGGTIFLDEINSMPLILQGKLLRVLQEKKVQRVGALSSIDLDIKVISSVNADPGELVNSGKFRMDLFYRLAVIYIPIPPLRERLVDIEELGRHFLQKYNQQLGKQLQNISPGLIDFFWNHRWPGNVRELEHVIESAVNMAGADESTLTLDHCYFANIPGISDSNLSSGKGRERGNIHASESATSFSNPTQSKPPVTPLPWNFSHHPEHSPRSELATSKSQSPPPLSQRSSFLPDLDPQDISGMESVQSTRSDQGGSIDSSAPKQSLAETKAEFEKKIILDGLERSMGNIAMAARILGMSRQLLGYKIKKMELRSELKRIKLKYM